MVILPVCMYIHSFGLYNKTGKTCWVLLQKKGRTHKRRPPMDFYTWTHMLGNQQKLTFISPVWTLDAV